MVPSQNIQEGIPADCSRWILANNTQAACWKLANDAKITMQTLFELNPILGANGERCASQVWLSYYYCIARKGDDSTPTSTKASISPTLSPVPKPTHTQAGITSSCTKFERASTGDGCWAMANRAGVELSSFYKWNSVLGIDGEQCTSQFWPDYYYCVGVATASTTADPTTTSFLSRPIKTQPGFPADCKKWIEAKEGDSCWAIKDDNNVALEQLYTLNPVLGENGVNCGTKLWPEYSYCLST
jgi:LysM repeat protein